MYMYERRQCCIIEHYFIDILYLGVPGLYVVVAPACGN